MSNLKFYGIGAALMLAVILCFVMAFLSACNPYAAAAKTTLVLRNAGDEMDRAVARKTKAETARCLKAHGPKTQGYNDCVAPWRKHRENWRKYARPSWSAAAIAAKESISLAYITKAGIKSVQGFVTALICVASKIALQFKNEFPKDAAFVVNVLTVAKGVSCP